MASNILAIVVLIWLSAAIGFSAAVATHRPTCRIGTVAQLFTNCAAR